MWPKLIIIRISKKSLKLNLFATNFDNYAMNFFLGKECIMFELVTKFKPSGDRPHAIENLVDGIKNGEKHNF